MIAVLGAAGLVAFAVASVAIGARLLAVGVRTRTGPELALGCGFLVGAVAGYVPETLVLSTDLLPADVERAVLAATQVAIRLAAVAVLAFTVHVFRHGNRWAHALAAAIVAALALSWLAFPTTQIYAQTPGDRIWYDVFAVARSAAIGWGALESLRYWRRARRRQRLGLADPLVAERFLLWGVGLGAMTALMASTLLARAAGVDPAAPGWVLLESLAGLVGAATLWLTFFPTRAYRARVARRAAGASGTGTAGGRSHRACE